MRRDRLIPVLACAAWIACAAWFAPPARAQPGPPPGIPVPPAPGTVAEIAQHAPTSVWGAWLSNGVRVYHRPTPAQDNRLIISVLLAGGELLETATDRGIASAAVLAWEGLGVSGTDAAALGAWAAERGVRWRAVVRPDALALRLDAPHDAAADALALVYALLAEPVVTPAAFEAWSARTRAELEERSGRAPEFDALVAATVFPERDARLRPVGLGDLERLSAPGATRWLRAACAGPVAIAIVGGPGPDEAYRLAASTIGALPPRPRIGGATYAELRTLPQFRGPARVEHADPRFRGALVMRGFIGADLGRLSEARRLRIAAFILDERVARLAEKLGAQPGQLRARSIEGVEYPGYGLCWIEAAVPASQVERAEDAFNAELASLASQGPTPEELASAQARVLAQIEELVASPVFWAERLAQLDYRNQSPKDLSEAPDDYARMTPEQVAEAVRANDIEPRRMTIILRGTDAARAADPP